MTDIVTLEEAKAQLRVIHDVEDDLIDLYIRAATEAVLDIADDWDPDGDAPVPDRIKMAVLTRVTVMFETRDSAEPGTGEDILLAPFRQLKI